MSDSVPMLPFVSAEVQTRIEQFLYYEAELLDERKFRDWLQLFTEDTHYWMPLRTNRVPRERHRQISSLHELATFDETKADLDQRIRKLETGQAWAEEPPSRTRHVVSNVRVRPSGNGLYDVRCNVLVYQARSERDEHWFVCERHDILEETAGAAGGLAIKRRKVVLDHTTINAPSVSIFF